MSHTPGPWGIVQFSWGDYGIGGGVCTVLAGANARTNAKLISAAPDLLAALEACEAQLSVDYPGARRDKYWPQVAPIIEEARAAIRKARGL